MKAEAINNHIVILNKVYSIPFHHLEIIMDNGHSSLFSLFFHRFFTLALNMDVDLNFFLLLFSITYSFSVTNKRLFKKNNHKNTFVLSWFLSHLADLFG